VTVPFSPSDFQATIGSKIEAFGTVAGRFGFAADRWLVYGKAGFAWAQQRHFQDQIVTIVGVPLPQIVHVAGSELHRGPMVGIGAEYAFLGNWSVKAEYNLLDFSDPKRVDQKGTLTNFAGVTTNVKTFSNVVERMHIAKVGVNYHFGPDRRPEVAPSLPQVGYNWSGLYLGIEGAGARSDTAWRGFEPFGNYDTRGWLAGGLAGARAQITPVAVAGVEAEIMGGRIDGSRIDNFVLVGGTAPESLSSRIDWLAMATAHFGLLATERWLIYGKGGVALAHARHRETFDFFANPGGGTSSLFDNRGDVLHTGGVFGAGTEYAFFGNWSAKLEYDYIRFTRQQVFLPGTITVIDPVLGTGTTSLPTSAEIRQAGMHLVKFGINYRIGPDLCDRRVGPLPACSRDQSPLSA
jgi:outer membrane immunogenic protein